MGQEGALIGVGLYSHRSSINTNCSRRRDGWRKKDLLLSWTDAEGTKDVSCRSPKHVGADAEGGTRGAGDLRRAPAGGALAGSRLEGKQPS